MRSTEFQSKTAGVGAALAAVRAVRPPTAAEAAPTRSSRVRRARARVVAHASLVSVLLALFTLCAPSVRAVIALKSPLSDVYAKIDNVFVGKVTGIDTDRKLVEAEVAEIVKGSAAGQRLRIQVVQPPELLKVVAAGQPVVVFSRANGAASINIGDTWVVSQPLPNVPMAWRTVSENAALKLSFPGRTEALVRVVDDLKARRSTFLEAAADPFAGDAKLLAKLNVSKPTFMLSADFRGDGKSELVVGTADGVRLFVQSANGFEDATGAWGLNGAAAEFGAVGDVNGDGKPDLILGSAVYFNDGTKLSKAADVTLPSTGELLAVGIGDATGGKRGDIAAIKKNGELIVLANGGDGKSWMPKPVRRLWKTDTAAPVAAALGDFGDDGRMQVLVLRQEGIVRYSLDESGPPPADFARLTGDRLGAYDRESRGFKGSAAFAMDVNGDGRLDFVIVNDAGGMVLINRGYGAFFVSLAGGRAISPAAEKKPPFVIKSGALCAGAAMGAGAMHELLVLGEDGQLWRMGNSGGDAAK